MILIQIIYEIDKVRVSHWSGPTGLLTGGPNFRQNIVMVRFTRPMI